MGACVSARIDDSDVLRQCKQRKRLMKDAVNSRQDFAIAHLAYIETLRNVGNALRRFSEGDNIQSYPRSPATPVLSLPQTSSPPVATLSPPPPPTAVAPPLSPPPPLPSPPSPPPPPSPQKAASPSPPHPSSPPATSPPSPPSSAPRDSNPGSPFSELRPPPPAPDGISSYADFSRSMSMPPLYMGNGIASPERTSNFFSPVYSPEREDGDEFYAAFSPPSSHIYQNSTPPPSPPPGSSSFLWDIFNPPPIPFHLQEHRRMKQSGEVEEEEPHDFDQVREEEGIPDLEEEEQKEEGNELGEQVGEIHGLKANAIESVADKSEKKLAEVSEIASMNSPDNAVKEEEKPAAVITVEKGVDVESEIKVKEKKELAVLSTMKGSNLTEVVRHIDDHFARAYDSGKDVSRMLETQMVYHHLSMSILDLKESSKVFNVITSYWWRKTSVAMRDAYDDNDLQECGMAGSHAATLERLYAWEKKLYDEVKAEELIRMAFDRKCKLLSNLDAKGEDPNLIDKTRAALKKLDTRLLVAVHAVQSASMRIQKLTNDELYPQLTELLGGLMNMWKVMFECHNTQKAIAMEVQTLENSIAGDEASEGHRKATVELEQELEKWQDHFNRWIGSQKKYINVLSSWLDLCHDVPQTHVKGRHVSPSWSSGDPPIFFLTKSWNGSLELLEKEKEAANVIREFAELISSLEVGQTNELNLKKQADKFEKSLDRKSERFMGALDFSNENEGMIELRSTARNNSLERNAYLDELRSVLENEKQKHSRAVQDRRDRTLGGLKENLPMVFESMAKFSAAALDVYQKLQQDTEHCNKCLPRENGDMHHV